MYEIIYLESDGYDVALPIDTMSMSDDLSGAGIVGIAVGGAVLGYAAGATYGHFTAWWAEKTEAGIQKAELVNGLKGAGIGALAGAGAYAMYDLAYGTREQEWSGDDW